MSEATVRDARSGVNPQDAAKDLRLRLYRGEHLDVAAEYLDGRLEYSRDDRKAAALVSLAVRHHFAALERDGKLTVDVVTEQVGDGLSITVKWPEDEAVDEVDFAFELVDDSGATRVISRRFAREMVVGQGLSRVFGRTLASDQTVVLRPIRSAATVSAVARPSHRLRFNDRSLAPAMRTCIPNGDIAARSDFEFEPVQSSSTNAIDVYGAAQGREILEIISLEEQRERVRRERARRRRELQIRVLRIAVLTLVVVGVVLGVLLVAARFIPELAEWLPFPATGSQPGESLETPQSVRHGLFSLHPVTEWHL